MGILRLAVTWMLAVGCGRVAFDDRSAGASDGGSDGTGDVGGTGDTPASVSGCQAVETASPLTASFDTALPAWAGVYGAGGVALANGGLELSPVMGQGAPEYSGIIEDPASDHRGQRIVVEVPQMLAERVGVQAIFRVRSPLAEEWAQLYVENGILSAETLSSGLGTGMSVPFDPTAHRWWQLREVGGVVWLETSPDGFGWTTIDSASSPALYASGAIELAAGYYQMQTLPLGTVRFDNLFVCE